MKLSRIIILLLLCLSCTMLEAAVSVHPYNLQQLESGSVYSLCQDNYGVIWMNTSYGLIRYNGHSSDYVLRPNPMHSIVCDGEKIYVPGSASLHIVDVTSLSDSQIHSQCVDFKNCVLLSEEGRTLLGYGNTIYSVGKDTLSKWLSLPDEATVTAMCTSADGGIICATESYGLYLSYTGNDIHPLYELPERVSALFSDRRGRIWAGLTDGGFVRIDSVSKSGTRYIRTDPADFSLPHREVRSFCADSEGNIYAGSVDGLFCINEQGECSSVPFNGDLSHSVCSLFSDRDGGIWVPTFFYGIFYLNVSSCPFSTVADSGIKLVNAMVEDSLRRVWVFTDNFGMFRSDGENIFTHIPEGDDIKFKSAVYDHASDCIWVGEYQGDLLRYDLSKRIFRHYHFRSADGKQQKETITDILIQGDSLFLATSSGLYYFNSLEDDCISSRADGYNGIIYSLSRDTGGDLWIGGNGLYRLDGNGVIVPAFSGALPPEMNSVKSGICTDVFFDDSGDIWISVVGTGLIHFSKGRARLYDTTGSGLASNYPTFSRTIGGCFVLVGTRNGISIINPSSGLCCNYSRSNGLGISSTRDGCFLRRADGTCWIGGTDGIECLPSEAELPENSISTIRFDRYTTGAASDRTSVCWIPFPSSICLAPGQRNFSIDIAGSDYTGATSRRYEYSFDAAGGKWTAFDVEQPLSFLNIRPGKYELRVRSRSGEYDEWEEISIPVTARSFWWNSIAARITYLLILLGMVVWILSAVYTRMKLSQQLYAKELENEERAKFFLRISRELRTPLSVILGQMEIFFRDHGHNIPGDYNLEKSYRNAKKMNEIISGFVEMENEIDSLPVSGLLLSDDTQADNDRDESASEPEIPLMLVVDGNHDMRSMFRSIFSGKYDIVTAHDGQEGYEKAVEIKPDIIISDVNLAKTGGIELCSKLRSNFATCDIPILLITSSSSEKRTLEAIKEGADGYILKPFNVEILEAHCRTLLKSRRILREKYVASSVNGPAEKMDVDDMHLINAAISVVERNLFSSDLNVPRLCRELNMSKSTLTARLSSLTGFTPREFIEDIRLKYAAQMLSAGNKRVSEISYDLGFSSPRYFTIRFKKKFGATPSEYLR